MRSTRRGDKPVTGKRYHVRNGVPERDKGWRSKVRAKVSIYAERGFAYEVRMPHFIQSFGVRRYKDPVETNAEVVEAMRRLTDCHVAGHGYNVKRKYARISVRLYLRREEDLITLRLVAPEVFRIYRLIPPPERA